MKLSVTLLVAVSLCACVASPGPMQRYVLETRTEADDLQGEAIVIRLQAVTLARYLAQSQLTLLRGEHGVYYANRHVWAEPLQHGFKRALARDLNSGQGVRLVFADEPAVHPGDFDLQLQIDNFSATEDSQALLSGKYWLFRQGEVVAARAFNLSTPLTADGYTHAVERQRTLIRELAEQIRAALPQPVAAGDAQP